MELQEYIRQLKEEGAPILESAPTIKIPNADEIFHGWMKYILSQTGKEYLPLPVYDEVIDYLKDSKGKGLLLVGNCGTGKTLITRYLFPIIFKMMRYHLSVFDATDLIKRPDEVLQPRFVAVDDLGTEATIANKFGQQRKPADELFDSIEKCGKLGFFSTNLSAQQLIDKYGQRSYDRLIGCTRQIIFTGESFRRKQ
jgi:DNA replication protein DnaC